MKQAELPVLPAEMEIFREFEQDEKVIDRIAAAQREELEQDLRSRNHIHPL